jgi:CheY-like chemotaxis protein
MNRELQDFVRVISQTLEKDVSRCDESFMMFGEEEALRSIPVIALTASAMKGNREEILAHGFDGYISKPIEEHALLNTIREKICGRK